VKRSPLLVLLLALALAVAGCGGGGGDDALGETAAGPGGETVEAPVATDNNDPETGTGTGEVTCSATDSGLALDEAPDLPPPVAELRERLFSLAGQCDYEGLAAIAKESEGFTYSFGGSEGDPAQFWRNQEEGALGEPMYALQMVLSLSHGRNEGGSFVWPTAATENATDEDWQELVDEGFYFPSDIEQMRESGVGYTGWRTGITPDGEWQFLVEGD